MVTTFILASLGPLAVFLGLMIFKNAFVTFLLFHCFVCIGVPVIDLYVVNRYTHRDAARALGLLKSRGAFKIGVGSGGIFLTVILSFFYIFQDNLIDVTEMNRLLASWNIRRGHIFILLFIMILANSVLEEIYWYLQR